MPSENWKVIPPEELAGFEPRESIVVRVEQWRKGRKEIFFKPGFFKSYAPSRGIVLVEFEILGILSALPWLDGEFCDNTVGRYESAEPHELHTDNAGYDE